MLPNSFMKQLLVFIKFVFERFIYGICIYLLSLEVSTKLWNYDNTDGQKTSC